MGIENSKECLPQDRYANYNEHPPWTPIACVPWDTWKNVCNPVFGIDYYCEWKNRQLKVQKRPWSRFAVHGKNAVTGKQEKVCSFSCCVSITGREEKLNGWLKDSSIIALHPRVAVIQLVLPRAVKLLIVDWHKNTLLATYTFAFSKEPCVQECYISPDATIMLCRQNFWLRRKLGHVTSFDPNIRVIQIKDGLCRRLFVIEDSLAYGVFGSGISLHPILPSGRATILSSTLQIRNANTNALDDVNNIQVFDFSNRQLSISSDPSLDHVIHHIKHSPDGRLLVAVLVNVSVYISCTLRAHELRIYDADALLPLHTMSLFDHITKRHVLQTFPVFSRDVQCLAQATGATVNVLRLPHNASSLQELCRIVIRHHTVLARVSQLPLPKAVIAFLDFRTLYEN